MTTILYYDMMFRNVQYSIRRHFKECAGRRTDCKDFGLHSRTPFSTNLIPSSAETEKGRRKGTQQENQFAAPTSTA